MDAQAALAIAPGAGWRSCSIRPTSPGSISSKARKGRPHLPGSAEGETAAARQITYLGRFALTWENQALISDWRSPVAALFYDFEPGPAAFEAPAGRREGTLALKRQISIEEGQLRYAVELRSSVRDEVLATVLGRTSDAKMHGYRLLHPAREQNAVIRDEAPGTLIIQGVAGSGKTSIALHRVAYLLYRQKERLTSQSVAILSPSRVFSDYISGVLPGAGVRSQCGSGACTTWRPSFWKGSRKWRPRCRLPMRPTRFGGPCCRQGHRGVRCLVDGVARRSVGGEGLRRWEGGGIGALRAARLGRRGRRGRGVLARRALCGLRAGALR